MIEAGSLCRLCDGQHALALGRPDADDEVRCLLTGSGLVLLPENFVADGIAIELRADKERFIQVATITRVLARLRKERLEQLLRGSVLGAVERHFRVAHAQGAYVPGTSPVPVAGRCYGVEEVQVLTEAALDFWLTTGRFNDRFEHGLGRFLPRKHVLTVNSGSSANLLAVSALTSPLLGERALRPGDEVITVAAGFPTTVNPILQNGLVPVFVDVGLPDYNIDPTRLADALSARTRAIVLAHTLGNPFDLGAVADFANAHDLWLIEDCCDALGSRYGDRHVGTFGAVSTFSFYPAHQITMGEGGAVTTDDPTLKRALESLRDWGRDCWCAPGNDNTCRKRFQWQLGDLPAGYDHKYTYSHAGYNLKITDMQAAVGCAQLERIPEFIARRRANFAYLYARLRPASDALLLPAATDDTEPAWFGFPITLHPEQRPAMLQRLADARIGTRLLFGGNLIRQPYFAGRTYRVIGSLANTDRIMHDTFWVGVYPALTEAMLDHIADTILDQLRGGRP